MKKIIIGASVAAFWLAGTVAFALLSNQSQNSGAQFTVLTVKEDTVKDYNSMPVFKDLAKETGTDVKWIYNTSTQYANNADPVGIKGIDAIYHSGFSNLKLYNYGRRNRIVAIDKYLSVMPNFKKILDKRPDIKEALKSPDGHIYSLPRIEEMGLKQYPNILYLNKEWVKELINNNNLPENVTLTEADLKDGLDLTRNQFKAILQKFNVTHPSGVPLSFIANNWQGNISDLVASFGLPENRDHKTIVYDEEEEKDKVIFTFTDEKWLAATQELSNWFTNKLFRTSVFTDSESDFLAKGQTGRYGSFYWWEKKTVVKNPDDYIIVKPLINDDTNERYVGVSNELEIEKGECVILDACQDKEGLLAYFDKFFEPKYSAQLNYGSISSGAFLSQTVNGKLIPNDYHGEQSADDFRMKNAPYGVVYLTQETWEKYVEMESRAKLRVSDLTNYVKPYTYPNVKSIPNLNYTQDELTTLNVYESSLFNNVAAWFTNSIVSGAYPSRDSWQNLININQTSINEILRINQDAYDRYAKALK